MPYINATFYVDSPLKDGVAEFHEVMENCSNLMMVNFRTSGKESNFDNTVCGVEFSKKEIEKLKKYISRIPDVIDDDVVSDASCSSLKKKI